MLVQCFQENKKAKIKQAQDKKRARDRERKREQRITQAVAVKAEDGWRSKEMQDLQAQVHEFQAQEKIRSAVEEAKLKLAGESAKVRSLLRRSLMLMHFTCWLACIAT